MRTLITISSIILITLVVLKFPSILHYRSITPVFILPSVPWGGNEIFWGGGMTKRDLFPSGKNSRPGGARGGGANGNFFASCLIPLGLTYKRGERGFKGGVLGAKF